MTNVVGLIVAAGTAAAADPDPVLRFELVDPPALSAAGGPLSVRLEQGPSGAALARFLPASVFRLAPWQFDDVEAEVFITEDGGLIHPAPGDDPKRFVDLPRVVVTDIDGLGRIVGFSVIADPTDATLITPHAFRLDPRTGQLERPEETGLLPRFSAGRSGWIFVDRVDPAPAARLDDPIARLLYPDLFVCGANTTSPLRLEIPCPGSRQAAWLPDGRVIAFDRLGVNMTVALSSRSFVHDPGSRPGDPDERPVVLGTIDEAFVPVGSFGPAVVRQPALLVPDEDNAPRATRLNTLDSIIPLNATLPLTVAPVLSGASAYGVAMPPGDGRDQTAGAGITAVRIDLSMDGQGRVTAIDAGVGDGLDLATVMDEFRGRPGDRAIASRLGDGRTVYVDRIRGAIDLLDLLEDRDIGPRGSTIRSLRASRIDHEGRVIGVARMAGVSMPTETPGVFRIFDPGERPFIMEIAFHPADLAATDGRFGTLDGRDIARFVELFRTGQTVADVDGDGAVDAGDITRFVGLFLGR